MRKVALLGNAGGGKSTLGARLSAGKGIPLHSVDLLQWKPGGVAVSDAEFERLHDEIIARDSWIIDGFGTYPAYLRRLEAADTIILVDHAIWRHYWWTARRNFLSVFQTPAGFPANTPLIRDTVKIAKFMWWVHRNFTPVNRKMIERYAASKHVFHLRSPRDIKAFCREHGLLS
jgi:adenylate kinase family enzyme